MSKPFLWPCVNFPDRSTKEELAQCDLSQPAAGDDWQQLKKSQKMEKLTSDNEGNLTQSIAMVTGAFEGFSLN